MDTQELKNSVLEDLQRISTFTTETHDQHRQLVIDKLIPVVQNLDLNMEDKPSKVKNKIELIRVFNETLREREQSILDSVKAKQKQVTIDNEQEVNNQLLGQFLQHLAKHPEEGAKLVTTTNDVVEHVNTNINENIDKELEDLATDLKLEITDGEVNLDPSDIDLDKILRNKSGMK